MADNSTLWPTVIVEIGLTSNNPTQLSSSLVLGDATFGKLGVGTLGISPTWSSIGQDIRSFTISRPMTRLQGPMWNYQAGTCSILLDNSDGTYDPDNLGGPFTVNASGLLPAAKNYVTIPCTNAYPALDSASTSYNLTSNFLSALVIPSQGADRETFMQMWNGANHVDMYYSGGTLAGRLVQGGVTTTAGSTAYNASAHRYWMILESAGTIYWYASPDGATWNLLWSHTYTMTVTSVQVIVTSGFFSTDVNTSTYVSLINGIVSDNFNVNSLATTWSSSSGGLTITPYSGVSQLLPMVPIRFRVDLSGLEYKLWYGYADGWIPAQVSYQGDYAELTLNGTDAAKILNGLTLAALGSPTGVGADTGARVADILTRAGWYTSAEWKAIDTGNSTLQGTTLGDTAWNLMQIAVDSELGQLYLRGDGAVVFRARRSFLTDARSNTVQAVFGDAPGTVQTAGTELFYTGITRANDDTTLINDVQATRVGGTLQETKDTASVATYQFPRTYPRSDLLLQTDADALNWSQMVVAVGRNAEDRFESITINPLSDPVTLWPQALGREIGDRIQIWHRPAAATSPITKDCFITGITHTVDVTNLTWQTTWTLQDASKYGSFMVLGNSTLGQLGLNALAF